MGGIARLVDVISDALHAFLEGAQSLAEALTELGELPSAKEEDDDDCEDDEVCRLKEFAP